MTRPHQMALPSYTPLQHSYRPIECVRSDITVEVEEMASILIALRCQLSDMLAAATILYMT